MRITVECTTCHGVFTVQAKRAGHRVACKLCAAVVRVPVDAAPVFEKADEPIAEPVILRRNWTGESFTGAERSSSDNRKLLGLGIGGGIAVLAILAIFAMNRGNAPQQVTAPVPVPISAPVPDAVPINRAATQIATPAATRASTTLPTSRLDEPEAIPNSEEPKFNSSIEEDPRPASNRANVDLAELIAQVQPAVVRINVRLKQGTAMGSGFVIDNRGTVVTSHYVMADAVSGDVQFADNSTAKILGIRLDKPRHGICVIQIAAPVHKLRPVKVATQLPPRGTPAVAFATPPGQSFTTSEGIINGLRSGKEQSEELGVAVEGKWLQTTCHIPPDSQGGPLTDHSGKVIGMSSMANFAISAVDIASAISEAPPTWESLDKADLEVGSKKMDKPASNKIDRSAAEDEIGTPRGQKLFSDVKEIVVLNVTNAGPDKLDPTGCVWDRISVRARSIASSANIDVSFDEPSSDATILLVDWQLKPNKKAAPGTQDLHVHAALVCYDSAAKLDVSPVVKVWELEDTVGTIALQALSAGQVPRALDEKLGQFFSKFAVAYKAAKRSQMP